MILHLVTDRRRLSPDVSGAAIVDCLVRQARFAADAGIDVIQVREPDLDARDLAALVSALIAETRQSRTRVVVNDRFDVAIACRAAGVHLRADSPDTALVRRHSPPGFLIGRSVHSPAEVAAAGPVDYLLAGTVWPTGSKAPGHPLLGLAGLAQVCAAARVPVLAIGGVEEGRVADLARAQASGAAGIGLFMASAGARAGACGAVSVASVVVRMREKFDRVGSRS